MKPLLLFAALCVAAQGQATSGTITMAINPIDAPTALITWDHPSHDPDPFKNNQPTKDSVYTMTMDEGFKFKVAGHVLVTHQEALDVVKAMEILSAPDVSVSTPEETSVMYATNPPTYDNSADSPAGLRRRADWLEKVAVMRAQREKDLAWARSILAAWKKKCEGASK